MGTLKRLSHAFAILLIFVISIIVGTYFQHSRSESANNLVARDLVEPVLVPAPAHVARGHHHKHHTHARRPAVPAVIDNSDDVSSSNVSLLMRRDDYSCGKGNPCSNGACCGASGYCGYGKTYCGAGCVSNCEAVAECGKDAVPSGKKCPLNTCCSQYGFCGTTQASNLSGLNLIFR